MIVKPLSTVALLPTNSGTATTLDKATAIHLYVAGTELGGGTTQDQDGVLINIVNTAGGAPVASVRVPLQGTLVIGKGADQLIFAEGNVYAVKIALLN
jgi:hypothetical protein